MPAPVQSPEKELRFTRAGQAVGFWIAAAVFSCIAVAAAVILVYLKPQTGSLLPRLPWVVVPLLLAWACTRTAIRLTRHAYLIFTPLGIEVFPFFRPAAGMRLVTWQEIADAEVDARFTRLTLHHNAEKSAGIHLSLAPIPRDRRPLLAKAIAGRLAERDFSPSTP